MREITISVVSIQIGAFIGVVTGCFKMRSTVVALLKKTFSIDFFIRNGTKMSGRRKCTL